MTQIGQPKPLLEGRPKVLGALRFAADLERPGMVHARLVTSPHAHARITSIDREAASRVAGVVAVLTADDLPEIEPASRGLLLLARQRAVFVGHPVALVLGESEVAAQDGADEVVVDYEPLSAAVDLDSALAPDATAVWPDGLPGRSAEAAAHGADVGGGGDDDRQRSPNIATKVEFSRGDLTTGFEAADVVVEREFDTAIVHQSYIEPHVSIVEPDLASGGATIWTSTQATFYVRDAIAGLLGVDHSDVRVIGTPVGGAFGGKFLLYEPLLALAARRIERSIRLVMTRNEEMLAANPAPATRISVRAGATSDGSLTALECELWADTGCFPSSMAGLAGILLGSLYQVPNQRVAGYEVLTFKPSTGAYRAPLAPQSAFALESVMDELAGKLGLDPFAFRRHNASRPGDPMAFERPWPGMGMHEVLNALESHPAWQNRDLSRAQGRGVGIAIGGWPGGTEPASAACSLQSDGTVQVHVGSADISGTNTTLALLAAEAFGVEVERIKVSTGDTTTAPFAGSSGGSKITYTMGPVVMQAAEAAREQTLALAAETFEADPADLEIVDGSVQVKGSPDKAISLAKIAQRTMRYGGVQAPVYAHGRHAQTSAAPGFCAQLAEVEVDPETGAVVVHNLVVVQDVGHTLNPLTVEGQMTGGALQGLGWALYEQMLYDDAGQLRTATLMDYAIPRTQHAPRQIDLVRVEVPAVNGPLGARGVGEPPVIPTAAAVANAIADATGVRLTRLPMTPPRVRAAIEKGS